MPFPGTTADESEEEGEGEEGSRRLVGGLVNATANSTSVKRALARDSDMNRALTGNIFYAGGAMVVAVAIHLMVLMW